MLLGFFQTERLNEEHWVDCFYATVADGDLEQVPPEERFEDEADNAEVPVCYRRFIIRTYPIEWSPKYTHSLEIHY